MQKKKAAPPVSDINVTPMVDVMLVLLIIFMVITPMLTKGVAVDMVKAAHPAEMPDADKEDAVIVAVTRDGKIFMMPGNVQLTQEKIPQAVKAKLELAVEGRKTKVWIRADARALYRGVEDVVDNLRAAGIDQIGLLTEVLPPQQGGPPPAPNRPAGGG